MKLRSFITPNTLTVTRIALIPFGVYTLFLDGGDNPSYQIAAWCIFFILGMTDIVDGKWARSSNRITPLGARGCVAASQLWRGLEYTSNFGACRPLHMLV
jgi:phosphatidylglycerophosphate synthase